MIEDHNVAVVEGQRFQALARQLSADATSASVPMIQQAVETPDLPAEVVIPAPPPAAVRKRGAKLKLSPAAAGLASELGSLLHCPPGQAVVKSMELTKALIEAGKIRVKPWVGEGEE